jgi:hypothetical protein
MFFSIHRSLQWILLNILDRDTGSRQNVFDEAVLLVSEFVPKASPIMVPLPDQWPALQQYLPQVLSLWSVYTKSTPAIRSTNNFAELLCNAGAYMYERGLTRSGLQVLGTANEVCDRLESKDLPETKRLQANVLAYAAGFHWKAGGITTRQEAHEWGRKIVELREAYVNSVGLEHVNLQDYLLLSNAYNDFGLQLIDEQDYDKAESYVLRSLQMKQARSGDIPSFELSASKACLGIVRAAQHRSDEALQLCAEATRAVAEEEGNDSVSAQSFKFDEAMIMASIGKEKESQALLKEILDFQMPLLSESNSSVLNTRFALAYVSFRLGNCSSARSSALPGNFFAC